MEIKLRNKTEQIYNELKTYVEAVNKLPKKPSPKKDQVNFTPDQIMSEAFEIVAKNQIHAVDVSILEAKFNHTYEDYILTTEKNELPEDIKATYADIKKRKPTPIFIIDKDGEFELLQKERYNEIRQGFEKLDLELVSKELEKFSQ